MSIEQLKQELKEMKREIRERHEAGEVSDELTHMVLEATRLANKISLIICGRDE